MTDTIGTATEHSLSGSHTYTRPPLLAIARGVPGSGKSHFAHEVADAATHAVKTVSLDDLRLVIDRNDGSRTFDRANEDFVQAIEAQIVVEAIEAGHDVIVHDTNIFAKRANLFRRLTAGICETVVVDFTDVNVDLCHERNLQRAKSVPPDVIDRMAKDERRGRAGFKGWLTVNPDEARSIILDGRPAPIELPQYEPDTSLPEAVIVDLDGTLAKLREGGRGPYDAARCDEDRFDHTIWRAAHAFPNVVLLSGREDKHRDKTLRWLDQGYPTSMVPWPRHELYMRATGDMRPDAIVKRELFYEHVAPKYNVLASWDDRNSVVAMWRRIGLACFQVAPGRF